METTGKIIDLSFDFKSRKPKATILLNTEELESIEKLKNEEKLNIQLKKWIKKRNLDCNAYMWVLIQKIAESVSTENAVITKEDIYKDAIKNVGAYSVVPIKNEAVEEWIRIWKSNGLGWQCETQPSKLEGFTNVFCYHGSSTYNQKEMNRLVEYIKQECNQLGIETKTEQELKSLLESWKPYEQKK